jgi:ADP-ribosyl-[dinitrogen reductase] hydrolase
MIGAVAGDIVGSVYEWKNYKAKDFSPLIREDGFYTDDTICTIAVADALLNGKPPEVCLKEWGGTLLRQQWLGQRVPSLARVSQRRPLQQLG